MSVLIDLTLSESESESLIVSNASENEKSENCSCPFEPALNIHGNILNYRHYRILQSSAAWFNDDLINGFFCKLADAHKDKVFVLSSFFYSSLLKRGRQFCLKHALPKGFKEFLRIDNRSSKGSNDKIVLIPVNSGGSHWVLVTWLLQKRTLEYYDSMMCKRSGNTIMKRISEFFNELLKEEQKNLEIENSLQKLSLDLEGGEESGSGVDELCGSIEHLVIPKGQIQQTDGSSCGPFCCYFAKHLIDSDINRDRDNETDIDNFNETDTDNVIDNEHVIDRDSTCTNMDIYAFRQSLIKFFLDK